MAGERGHDPPNQCNPGSLQLTLLQPPALTEKIATLVNDHHRDACWNAELERSVAPCWHHLHPLSSGQPAQISATMVFLSGWATRMAQQGVRPPSKNTVYGMIAGLFLAQVTWACVRPVSSTMQSEVQTQQPGEQRFAPRIVP